MIENDVVLKERHTYTVTLTEVDFNHDCELVIWAQAGEDADKNLESVAEKLQDAVPEKKQLPKVEPGTLCMCQYTEDQEWYRACIESQTASGKWKARFIDYGNCQVFDQDSLYQLPTQLCQLPAVTTKFVLDDSIQPVHSAGLWTSAVIKPIVDAFMYNKIEINVTKACSGQSFEIRSPSINSLLVQNGLASFETAYPRSFFPVGEKFQAYVSNASKEGTLYLQELESSKKLDELMNFLSEHYSMPENLVHVPSEELVVGNLVAAVYSQDHGYYRAQITNAIDDSCTVCYIDYGNSEQQEKASLFVLPNKFRDLNYQAVPCELHDVHVPEEHYSKQLQSVLLDKLYEQLVDIEIVGHGEKLSICGSYQGERLGSSLVVGGFAKVRHAQSNHSFKYMEIEEGSTDDMLISHVTSNGIFYLTKLSEACAIDKLTIELAAYCSSAQRLTNVANEMPCCALFDLDDSWYRAVVKSCDQSQVVVYYVDFGNTATCDKDSLRCISESLLSLNCQAIKCSILRALHDDEIKMLGDLVGEVVKVKFLKKDEPNSYTVKVIHDGKTLFLSSAGNSVVTSNQELESKEKVMLQPQIKLGTVNLVQITYIESINKIWGRLKSNDEQFQQMCEKLDTHCNVFSGDTLKSVQSSIMLESVCAVSDLSSGKWFRAKIRSMPSKLMYSVILVDVGETKNVSVDDIKMINDHDLIEYPAQALSLSLQNSIGAIDDEQFAKLCSFLQDNTFPAKFVNHYEGSGSYEVELVDANEKLISCVDNMNINGSSSPKSMSGSPAIKETFELVAVCFVEDPDCMWIQQLSSDRQLFQLLKDMNLFYSNLPSNVLCFHQPQFDSMCSVKIKEEDKESWYRGRVLCLYGDVIEVKLIDFGNEVRTTLKNIKVLSSQFENIAPHALRCKLFNVKPTSEQWSVAAIHRLFKLTKEAKTIKARFMEKQGLSHVVDLLVDLDGKEMRVSDNLVELNHAVWIDQPVFNGKTSPAPSSSHTSNIDRLSVTSSRSSRSGLHRLFYQSPGVALVGAEIKVLAAEVESPDDFFITIDDPSYRNRYIQLAKEVNASCSTFYPDIREEELYVGMPCCVFYDKTKQWCRGAVLNFQDLEKLQVCLVDYGCMLQCKLSSVQSISSQFVTEAPPAALRCTLRGIVEANGSAWSLQALSLTQNFFRVNQQNLTCTMHGCASDDIGTYFMCSIYASQNSLADELVNAGVGVKSKTMGQLSPPLKLKSFVFSNSSFVKGKDLKFYVSHVVDFNLFYCQLALQIPVINSMLHELQQHCIKGDRSVVTPEMLTQDCVCFAKLDGKQWNRAHFISSASNGIVKVMFVDHGNTGEVSLRDVQKFSNDKFFLLPIQALPCCLEGVHAPLSDTKRREVISQKMQKLLSKQILHGVVTGSTNGKLHLDLFCDGKRINDLVTMEEADLNQLSSVNTLASVPSHPLPSGELPTHVSSARANLSEHDLSENAVFDVYSTTSETLIDPANVWKGERPVFISHVASSDRIFLQDQDTLASLEKLMFEINDDVKLETVVHPTVNSFCFARYDVDDQLYRAVIEKVISEPKSLDRFLVKFVDYGNTSIVESSDLKALTTNFTVLPQVALPCVLNFLPETLTSDEIFVKLKELSISESESLLASLEFHQRSGHCSADVKVVSKGKGTVSLYMYLLGNSVSPEKETTIVQSAVSPKYTAIDSIVNRDNCEVYISHVENPGHFYCQLSDSCGDLDKMMSEIEVYYGLDREEDHIQSLQALSVGLPCIAKYQQDGKWYRASVKSLGCSDKITVRFVDYGNVETLSVSEVRKISLDFCVLPVQAIHCHAACVNNDASAWTVDEVDAFDDRVAELQLQASFSKVVDEKEHIFEVTLKLPDGSLLNNDYSKCSTSDLVKTDKCGSPANAINEQSKISSAQTTTSSLCHFSSDDITLTVPNIQEGTVKDCYVSFAKTSTNFYVQLAESETDIDSLYALASEDALSNQSGRFDASVGKYCVAQSPSDGEWYRGKITEAGEKATVFFVDYGDSATVEWKNVKPMTKQTASLPIQGICCHLSNLSDFSQDYVNSLSDAFSRSVMDKLLTAKFLTRRTDMQWEVSLTVDGLDVAEKLRGTLSSSVENDQSAPVTSFSSSVPTKVDEPPVNSASIQKLGSGNETKTVRPGVIRKGEVVYVASLSSFYIKIASVGSAFSLRQSSTTTACEDQKSDGLKIFLAKHLEENNWQDTVIVKTKNGDHNVLFIDDLNVVKREEVYEIRDAENSPSSSSRIFHCRLPDLKCSESVSKMQYFNNHVLRKEVFITFLEFHPGSLSWIVDLALVNNDIDVALQGDVLQLAFDNRNAAQEHTSEELSQHVIATSDVSENSKLSLHTIVKPQLKDKCTVEDCLAYFTFVCNEVKGLLHNSTPSEDVIKVIDDTLFNIKMHSKSGLKIYAGGDSSSSFYQNIDDHKRSSSVMLSVVGPPKKPRLGNVEKASVKNEMIHQDIEPHSPCEDEQHLGTNEFTEEEKQSIDLETVVHEGCMEQSLKNHMEDPIEDKHKESNQSDKETSEDEDLCTESLISVADEILDLVFKEAWHEVPPEPIKDNSTDSLSSPTARMIFDSDHAVVPCNSADRLDSCKERALSFVPFSESQIELVHSENELQKTVNTNNTEDSSLLDACFVAGRGDVCELPSETNLQNDVTLDNFESSLVNENSDNNESLYAEDDATNGRNDLEQHSTTVGDEAEVFSNDDEYGGQDIASEVDDGCVGQDVASEVVDECVGWNVATKVDDECVGQDVTTKVDDQCVGQNVATKVDDEFVGQDVATKLDQCVGQDVATKVDDECVGQDVATKVDDEFVGQDVATKVDDECVGQDVATKVDDEFVGQDVATKVDDECVEQDVAMKVDDECVGQDVATKVDDECVGQDVATKVDDECVGQDVAMKVDDECVGQDVATKVDDECVGQDLATKVEDECVGQDVATKVDDGCVGQDLATKVEDECVGQDVATEIDDGCVEHNVDDGDVATEEDKPINSLCVSLEDDQISNVALDMKRSNATVPFNDVEIPCDESEVEKINGTDEIGEQTQDLVEREANDETEITETSLDQTETSSDKVSDGTCAANKQALGNAMECIDKYGQEPSLLSDTVEINPDNEERTLEEENGEEEAIQNMSFKSESSTFLVGWDSSHDDINQSMSSDKSEATNLESLDFEQKGDGYATASDELVNDSLNFSGLSTPVPAQFDHDNFPKTMHLADTSATPSIYSTPVGCSRGDPETVSSISSSHSDAFQDACEESSSHPQLSPNVSDEDSSYAEGLDC